MGKLLINKTNQKSQTAHCGFIMENRALFYLQEKGFSLVQRNFRCARGEIDLILEDSKHLLFVEVRFRKNKQFGGAASSITPAKQRKISYAAQYYLYQRFYAKNRPLRKQPRLDVVCLGEDQIQWIQNAFEVPS